MHSGLARGVVSAALWEWRCSRSAGMACDEPLTGTPADRRPQGSKMAPACSHGYSAEFQKRWFILPIREPRLALVRETPFGQDLMRRVNHLPLVR